MRKNRIRLTESQLHGIIKEAIETIVDEGNTNYRYVKGANEIFHKLVVDDSDISVDEQGYLLKQPGNYNLYGTPTQEIKFPMVAQRPCPLPCSALPSLFTQQVFASASRHRTRTCVG